LVFLFKPFSFLKIRAIKKEAKNGGNAFTDNGFGM